MKFLGVLIFVFSVLIQPCNSFAKGKTVGHKTNVNIPEVALLALRSEGHSNISFTSSTNSAGSTLVLSAKQQPNIWINYSSVIKRNQKRKITAMVQGEIPEGLVLKVKTSESRGDGMGELGYAANAVSLSNSPTVVVSGIGSCYTGRGVQNGHLISYEMEVKDEEAFYLSLSEHQTSVSVVYTLTDDN